MVTDSNLISGVILLHRHLKGRVKSALSHSSKSTPSRARRVVTVAIGTSRPHVTQTADRGSDVISHGVANMSKYKIN